VVCPACSTPVDGSNPVRPRPTRFTGAMLDERWEVLGFVASGATSRVYAARDTLTGRPVVVKMFAPQIAHHEALHRLFIQEGTAVTHVEHPNVVRVLATGEGPEGPYLVMEALRGETLGDRLRRSSRFGRTAALELVREAARGLAAVHDAGVIHRDVKPDNLYLVRSSKGPATVKLIDFGMASVVNQSGAVGASGAGGDASDASDAGDPSEGLVLGTPDYMAPEQIVCDPVDARTDVYALGVTLFRLYTGRLPFEAEPGRAVLRKQLFERTPPPSLFVAEPDPWVDRIVRAATQKRPENRYASMHAMAADLESVLGLRDEPPRGSPVVARPDVYVARSDEGRAAVAALAR
jgi:serine/threonine-protein kinase